MWCNGSRLAMFLVGSNGPRAAPLLSSLLVRPAASFFSTAPNYEYIKTDVAGEKKNVAVITFNRPKALNALCTPMMVEVVNAVRTFEKDKNIGAIIITGSKEAFAAGGDIKELQFTTFMECFQDGFLAEWAKLPECTKPVIAAVNGYALGGGCEFALMCDIIYAGDEAKFAQREISIGTMPGFGGTQRMARVVGKSNAMEICMTGDFVSAQEAKAMGIVSKVFPPDQLLGETIKLGEKIASHSQWAIRMIKEAVNQAFETTLHAGLLFERKLFFGTFATKDRLEGMSAFVEKRPPRYKNN